VYLLFLLFVSAGAVVVELPHQEVMVGLVVV
jgi:hypothetical protein